MLCGYTVSKTDGSFDSAKMDGYNTTFDKL